MAADSPTPPPNQLRQLEERVAKLQRAVYYLVWRRGSFGDRCIHCDTPYPNHAPRCMAAEVEALVR